MDVEQIVRGENALLGDFTDALSARSSRPSTTPCSPATVALRCRAKDRRLRHPATCREYVRRMIVGSHGATRKRTTRPPSWAPPWETHIEAAMTSEEVRSQVTVAVN